MQDRFKFRVWDKENKCLHYPTRYSNFTIVNGIVVKIESYPIANSAYLGKRIAWEFDYAVIMQCTGLKDKNGKLIYEDDIVRFKDNITINGSKTHIAVIEHNEAFNSFMYHAECMGLYTVNKAQNKQFNVEVIGNIYENPELLEVENDNK